MMHWEKLKAEDVMSHPLIAVDAGTMLREAAQTLSENRISGALVVDTSGAPVGVVSLFDIVSYLAGLDRPAGEPGGFYRQAPLELGEDEDGLQKEDENPVDEGAVRDIMAPEIISVRPDTPLPRVAEILRKRRIHRVFVAGESGPVGVISTMDVLAALAGKRRAKVHA